MNKAEGHRTEEELYREAVDAFRLYYLAEKKASAEVSELLAASNEAMAAYNKASAIALKLVAAAERQWDNEN